MKRFQPSAAWTTLASSLLVASVVQAGPARLVKDIDPRTNAAASSEPNSLVGIGETVYFSAIDGFDQEIWRTDGTAEGTVMLKDVRPGPSRSTARFLTRVGSTLYFIANDGTRGTELWKSDGTAAGTTLVKDITPGPDWTFTFEGYEFEAVGDRLYFIARTPGAGRELWTTDGTAEGTRLVRDITPGPASTHMIALTAVGDTLYLAVRTSEVGQELWRSDGTEAGTFMLKDILPGPGSSFPGGMTAVGTTVFFQAWDAANEANLWKTDGTPEGTVLVKQVPGGLIPFGFVAFGPHVYFSCRWPEAGAELCRSDGTEAGTVLVRDINPGPTGSWPEASFVVNGQIILRVQSLETGIEVWKSRRYGGRHDRPQRHLARRRIVARGGIHAGGRPLLLQGPGTRLRVRALEERRNRRGHLYRPRHDTRIRFHEFLPPHAPRP